VAGHHGAFGQGAGFVGGEGRDRAEGLHCGELADEGVAGVLAAAEERVRGDQPKISVRTTFLPDDPRAGLEATRDAELLVVGSHGYGTFAGMLLGSVSHALLHQAPCPLAVVRITR
jgi:nucleotide-binding universal stress UspA family protein